VYYLDGSSALTFYGTYLFDWYALQTNLISDIFEFVQQNRHDIGGGEHRESKYY